MKVVMSREEKTWKDPWQARSGQLLEMNETAVVWVSEVVWNSFRHFMSYIWGNRGPRTLSDSPKLSKPGSSDSTSGFLCSSRQSSCLLSVCLLQLEISTVLGALVTVDPILFLWVWDIVSGTVGHFHREYHLGPSNVLFGHWNPSPVLKICYASCLPVLIDCITTTLGFQVRTF